MLDNFDNFLIPKMLLVCIQNERGVKIKKFHKQTISLLRHHKYGDPEVKKRQYKKISAKRKEYWVKTPKKTLEKMCKKRAISLKKYLAKLTKEELQARTSAANKTITAMFKDPKTKDRLIKISIKNFSTVNNVITKKIPRINNYSGTITASELESL